MLFLLWQKQHFKTGIIRVFDSYLFIKGLFVRSKYSTAESSWATETHLLTLTILLTISGFLKSQILKNWSWSISYVSPWLSFQVKRISYSQDLQTSLVIEILWSSLWLLAFSSV